MSAPAYPVTVGLRRLTKQLTCGTCGDVIADAVYRPWRASLVITAVQGGYRIQPTGAGLQERLARQAAAAAPAGRERQEQQRRAEFIARYITELIYAFTCPRGHRMLMTEPQVIAATRRTPGNWVSLS